MAAHHFRRSIALLLVAAMGAGRLSAQGIEGQIGRFYDDGGWDVYRLGVSRPLTGPVGLGLQGSYLRRADGGEGGFAGLSLDLTAFKGAGQGPYLVAGVGAGMGSPSTDQFSNVWGSWSVGAGYQLLPASFLSFGAEARWRELSLDARDGLEMAAGFSIRFGGRDRPARPSTPEPPLAEAPPPLPPAADSPASPADERDSAPLREAVVATAREAMGRPYQWGLRLLRSHPVRVRPARHHAAAHQPGSGQGGTIDLASRRLAPPRRPPHLLQCRRPSHPRGALHRRRPLHPQREPRGASEPAERR